MNEPSSSISTPLSLEQLLLREDVWVGHSRRFNAGVAVDTGYDALNGELLNGGWPAGSLIEVCQHGMQAEWQLFMPALQKIQGLIVALNPPAMPFAQAFIQAGINLDRLIIVEAPDKAQFIACFTELVRASIGAVLAWQPQDAPGYTELRKCQLAAAEGQGLCVMFRPSGAQQQSSPAVLRLYAQTVAAGLELTLFKQRGYLQLRQPRPIVLALPEQWQAVLPYRALNEQSANSEGKETERPLARVLPLRSNQ